MAQAQSTVDWNVGGFARLQAVSGGLSPSRRLAGDQQLWIPHIPLAGDAPSGPSAAFSAKESRVWATARRDSPWGEVNALVEYDFFDSLDSYRPRLRHAYASLGALLLGQTFTTFTNTSALADIDGGVAVGNVVTRHAMLRWTQELGEGRQLMLAAEEPLTRSNRLGEPAFQSQQGGRPDLVLRLNTVQTWGNVSLSLMNREARLPTAETAGQQSHADRSPDGFALGLAGRLETGSLNNLRFMFHHGKNLGRHATLATYADAFLLDNGKSRLERISTGLLAYQHFWMPSLRSTFAYSQALGRLPQGSHPNLTRQARSAHLNLIWAPNTRASLGLEYLHGQRRSQDGRRGELHRMQVTLRINFF